MADARTLFWDRYGLNLILLQHYEEAPGKELSVDYGERRVIGCPTYADGLAYFGRGRLGLEGKHRSKGNAVHFAIRMTALKSMRVVGCGVRGRNG